MCHVRLFKGFVVALEDTGIHAIKIISGDGQDSSWIGEFNGVCVTRPSYTGRGQRSRILF